MIKYHWMGVKKKPLEGECFLCCNPRNGYLFPTIEQGVKPYSERGEYFILRREETLDSGKEA